MQTSYTSRDVEIDSHFLATPSIAEDAQPISAHRIDFRTTPLRARGAAYAIVLDNVLSASECTSLIALAEAAGGPWTPALVNSGPGREALIPEYRNSERIIWDHPELMERLWQRCLAVDGLAEDIGFLDESKPHVLGPHSKKRSQWRATRLNERMRFLRYEPGMFFREHCDGAYEEPKTGERSFFTLHLYLNDSAEGLSYQPFHIPASGIIASLKPNRNRPKGGALRGGATTFFTDDMRAQIDVFPRAGRVLIFQHRALLHSGADVLTGVKYTMRTDLMFERVRDKDEDKNDD